jgi:hypothetical protein
MQLHTNTHPCNVPLPANTCICAANVEHTQAHTCTNKPITETSCLNKPSKPMCELCDAYLNRGPVRHEPDYGPPLSACKNLHTAKPSFHTFRHVHNLQGTPTAHAAQPQSCPAIRYIASNNRTIDTTTYGKTSAQYESPRGMRLRSSMLEPMS